MVVEILKRNLEYMNFIIFLYELLKKTHKSLVCVINMTKESLLNNDSLVILFKFIIIYRFMVIIPIEIFIKYFINIF